MRELELDGIHDDGEHVLLVDSDGERYTLRIDKALRAAVRSDRPALNMIQAADATPLRPREIQSMLRAGRSAEDISEASEIPLEHVRRYEGPVLAEREWTAQRARSFPVGRGGPSLVDVVGERLAAREATGDSAWDAWRRQDGTWTLELTFSAGGRTRQAHWVADIDNRSVSPTDDEARWISDEDAPPEPTRGRGRLQAVKSAVYDLEADGSLEGEPATPPRNRSWPLPRPLNEEHPSTIEDSDLDALNARRGLRSVPRPDEAQTVWSGLDEVPASEESDQLDLAPDVGPDAAGTTAKTFPVGHTGQSEQGEQGEQGEQPDHAEELEDPDREAELEHSTVVSPEEEIDSLDGHGPAEGNAVEVNAVEDISAEDSQSTVDTAEPEAEPAAAAEDEIQYQDTIDLTPLPGFDDPAASAPPTSETPKKPAKKTPRSKSKRASMPSWDEIVFGSKHD